MIRESVWFRGLLCAIGAILLLSTPMLAATGGNPSPSPAFGTVTIATGSDSSADGYLEVSPDDYGAWASAGFGGGGDGFNPSGARGLQEVSFTDGFFLFNPAFGQRELLSDNDTWQAVFPADASLSRSVTSPLAASDSSGDGVDDTLISSFDVGGGLNLSVEVTQTVSSDTPGVSFLQQDYVITNNASGTVNLTFVRVLDADLVWGAGNFADDEVGTTMHGAGVGPYVFQQEASDPGNTAVTLSGPTGGDYFGGKQGVEPENGPPEYGFGTDVQVWEAFGIPTTWESHIAGVGYDKNGVSGTQPDGVDADGFIGLEFPISLGGGEETTISVLHTFGANTPSGDQGPPPVPATSYQGVIVLGLLLLTASMALVMWRRRTAA